MRRMIVVLTAVMVLSGLVLAATHSSLTDRIEANRVAALNASLASIFADRTGTGEQIDFEEVPSDGPTIYRGATANDDLLGYAVRLQTQGYGGTITMLVGISPDLDTILGIEVVEQVETPGLGGKITTPEFKAQFEDLDADEQIAFVKNVEPDTSANEVQAISGATITTRAVVAGINATLDRALDIIERQAR
jgi:Na+-translocating ferredoxin:NAD+ oxidoreductase subunit G